MLVLVGLPTVFTVVRAQMLKRQMVGRAGSSFFAGVIDGADSRVLRGAAPSDG
ncbi:MULTISPECIES: hypothetical protein [unclassified Streptomyces]|uniref:hypothetical protein n=1 Tax=unclassified Streptomyces TaxID=2593676 RepID=UPI000AA66391|nr:MULTISPECIES: hypothetical protein [unclassified Streptomyces]